MMLLPTTQTTFLVNVTNPEYEGTISKLQNKFQEFGKLKKLVFSQERENHLILVEFEKAVEALNAYQKLNKSIDNNLGTIYLDFVLPPPGEQINIQSPQKKEEKLENLVEKIDKRIAFGDITNQNKQNRNSLYKQNSNNQPKVRLSKGSMFLNRQSIQEKSKQNPFKSKMQRSKVVLISNLENLFQSAKQVFNLFSSFGNIKKLILMKNLNKAMIEYYEDESSLLCALNINNLKIFNTELRVNYSKYQTIDLEKNNKNKNSVIFNEVFIPSKIDHRYQKDDVKQNISKFIQFKWNGSNQDDFLKFLQSKTNGEIYMNKKPKYFLIKIEFQKIQDSLKYMIQNHNLEYNGKRLKLFFVKQF